MKTKRVKSAADFVTALFDNFPGEFGEALTEYYRQTLAVESEEAVQQQAHHQQQLDPVCQPISEEPLESKMPVKEVGDTELCGKRKRGCSSSSIPEAAFLLCPLEKV